MFKYILLLIVIIVGAFNFLKPLPAGTSVASEVRNVPSDSIQFFADRTYVDETGTRQTDHQIFDEMLKMVEESQKYIILDMFLFNTFQGEAKETNRFMTAELTNALVKKKETNESIEIVVITDEINTMYGAIKSPHLGTLKDAGVQVIITDLSALRDSNAIYSAVYRTFFSWFGNSTKAGLLPNPFIHNGSKVSLRTYLRILNAKANHRKVLITDSRGEGFRKVHTLITSMNIHDNSSAHGNVAVKVSDAIWKDAVDAERSVAEFSGENFSHPASIEPTDSTGNVKVQYLSEGKIRDSIVNDINELEKGDSISMAMFYLSEKSVVEALQKSAMRGVKIRLLLDQNKDAFGREKNGIPNRVVAGKLGEYPSVQIRWCDTHGEQCHAKLTIIRKGLSHIFHIGSANLTRRNIGNYNLEANLRIESETAIDAVHDVNEYFEEMWENRASKKYSISDEELYDNSLVSKILYFIGERLGFSTY